MSEVDLLILLKFPRLHFVYIRRHGLSGFKKHTISEIAEKLVNERTGVPGVTNAVVIELLNRAELKIKLTKRKSV